MQAIYLDYNATTPLAKEVVEFMQPILEKEFGNPSSSHAYGIQAKKILESSRAQVAGMIGCSAEEIIFTSGGTESINYALKGAAMARQAAGRHIITLEIEHPATLEVCRFLEKKGFEVSYLPVDSEGILAIDILHEAIRPDTILVSVMHANNELGSIQPIAEIGKLAEKKGFIFHTDAAQSAGKLQIDVHEMGVDLLSIAGHKLYGPKGIGALYIKHGTPLEKLIHGADHEANRRAGTENVPLIAGLGMACELVSYHLETFGRHMRETRDRLWDRIQEGLPEAKRNGSSDLCLPNTLNISFPGIDSQMILSGLPEIAVSAGAACHAEQQEVSHVLKAIGLPNELAIGTLRISTGRDTTTAEIDAAADALLQFLKPVLDDQTGKTETGAGTGVKLTQYSAGLGCACKMRPQDLASILRNVPIVNHPDILVDTRNSDDASVWRMDDSNAWVQSVDFFTPIVDDPYTFGRIAASNALSDLYAMGAIPVFALNIVAFPVKRLPLSVLGKIMEGASRTAEEAGIHILGGHSIEDNELKFGMVVNGHVHPDRILRNQGARPGDALVLTKPLGTGILSTALKRGILESAHYEPLIQTMCTLNKRAAECLEGFDIHACTDVTGFGLLGHLLEMLKASKVSAHLHAGEVPLLGGLETYLQAGMAPGGSLQNLEHAKPHIHWDKGLPSHMQIILADAQTSGGLLIALPYSQAPELQRLLKDSGCSETSIVGEILKPGNKHLSVSN